MNAALRTALAAAQLTETDVAARVGVDPKTVRRWLSGTRPYPRHRWAVADLLGVDEDALWPKKSHQDRTDAPASEHVQRVYAHRWQVPREVWWDLFNSAEQEIGILAYSALFLADDAGLLNLIGERARVGVNVRILLGNPDCQALSERSKEENLGDILAARSRNSFKLFQRIMDAKNVHINSHCKPLYSSIYITENRVLANHHIYGTPAAMSPVVEVNRNPPTEMSEMYYRNFEETWNDSDSL